MFQGGIIVVIVLVAILCSLCEHLYWLWTIKQLKQYILPVIDDYNLRHIPITPRFFGAITFDKRRITMCIRYNYSVPRLAYVLLHEYAHVITVSIGHTPEFWARFAEMLDHARVREIYIDDYFAHHSYCTR